MATCRLSHGISFCTGKTWFLHSWYRCQWWRTMLCSENPRGLSEFFRRKCCHSSEVLPVSHQCSFGREGQGEHPQSVQSPWMLCCYALLKVFPGICSSFCFNLNAIVACGLPFPQGATCFAALHCSINSRQILAKCVGVLLKENKYDRMSGDWVWMPLQHYV